MGGTRHTRVSAHSMHACRCLSSPTHAHTPTPTLSRTRRVCVWGRICIGVGGVGDSADGSMYFCLCIARWLRRAVRTALAQGPMPQRVERRAWRGARGEAVASVSPPPTAMSDAHVALWCLVQRPRERCAEQRVIGVYRVPPASMPGETAPPARANDARTPSVLQQQQ